MSVRSWRVPAALIVVLAAIPVLWFLEQFVRHYAGQGWDYLPIWNATRNLLHHHALYFQGRPPDGPPWPDVYYLFVYPPSVLLAVWPLGLLSFAASKLIFILVDGAAIVLAGVLCLKLFNVRWRSLAGVVCLGGLFFALPVTDSLHSGNVNGLVVGAEAAMLLAATRQRWLLAGAFLGVSMVVKPILLPLIVLFLLARKSRGALLALAIPVVLSLAIVPFSADGGKFFTRAVPFLLNGNAAEFQEWNISLAGLAAAVGWPPVVALALRGLLVTIGGFLIWWRWRVQDDEALRLVEVSGLIVLVVILGFSFAWQYHVLFLLPWVFSAWRPRSVLRHPLAWAGILLAASPEIYFMERSRGLLFHLAIARITLGLLVLFAAAVASLAGQRRAEAIEDERPDAPVAAASFGVL